MCVALDEEGGGGAHSLYGSAVKQTGRGGGPFLWAKAFQALHKQALSLRFELECGRR